MKLLQTFSLKTKQLLSDTIIQAIEGLKNVVAQQIDQTLILEPVPVPVRYASRVRATNQFDDQCRRDRGVRQHSFKVVSSVPRLK